MPVIEKNYRELFRRLGITTMVVMPVAAVLVAVSIVAAMFRMDSSTIDATRRVFAFFYPWAIMMRSSIDQDIGDMWFLLGMGLQIVVYAWIWSIGRFYKIHPLLLLFIISVIHFVGCGLRI